MNLTRTITRPLAALAASTLVAGLAVAATTTTSEASASSTSHARAGKTFKVTLTVNNLEPEQGTAVKLKGQVKPLRPGTLVQLQKRYEGDDTWKLVAKDELNKNSKFKFKDVVDSVRVREYRVVKPHEVHRGAGESDAVKVTVFGWRDLTSLGPIFVTGTSETSNVKINGTDYPQSIQGNNWGNSGTISYNIDRKCKRLDARVGLGDLSESTATGQVNLKADSSTFYSNSFGLTQSAAISRDVTGVFRLTFDWTSSNTAGTPEDQSGAIIAIGSPKLLCSF
jgi:hypothetical protein